MRAAQERQCVVHADEMEDTEGREIHRAQGAGQTTKTGQVALALEPPPAKMEPQKSAIEVVNKLLDTRVKQLETETARRGKDKMRSLRPQERLEKSRNNLGTCTQMGKME